MLPPLPSSPHQMHPPHPPPPTPLPSSLTKCNVSLLGGKLPDDDIPRLHIEVDHVLRLGAHLHLQRREMTFDLSPMLPSLRHKTWTCMTYSKKSRHVLQSRHHALLHTCIFLSLSQNCYCILISDHALIIPFPMVITTRSSS